MNTAQSVTRPGDRSTLGVIASGSVDVDRLDLQSRLYTLDDLAKLVPWSRRTVEADLNEDPACPLRYTHRRGRRGYFSWDVVQQYLAYFRADAQPSAESA